jgi:hypothetical protein
MLPKDTLELESAMEVVRQKRLRRDWMATAEERLARFELLQATVLETLTSNRQGLELFHRRNRHQRRQAQVRRLESQLLRTEATPLDDRSQHA